MESEIKNILIPTCLTESSGNSIEIGIAIAKMQNARITLLYNVINKIEPAPGEQLFIEIDQIPEYPLHPENQLKEYATELARIHEISVLTSISSGDPVRAIIKTVSELKVDLLVIGKNCLPRKIFNSATQKSLLRIIKGVDCPVLTIPEKWSGHEFQRVLFPLRLVPRALSKYAFSKMILKSENSEVYILALAEMDDSASAKEMILLVESLKKILIIDGLKYQVAYSVNTNYLHEVLKTSEVYKIDLIVITANMIESLNSNYLGLFVRQILGSAETPVLSIK